MSKTFTEQLQVLANNPNLGRGFITLASANLLKAQKQTTLDTLSNLNKAMGIANTDVATTADQLKRLQQDTIGTDALANISDSAAQYEALTKSLVERKKKFGETFNKTMMALSVIGGQDAQLATDVIRERKTDLLKNIDELVALPDKTLRRKIYQTNLMWSQDKYAQVLSDRKRMNQIREVEAYMSQHRKFKLIHGGDYNTYSPTEQNEYDENTSSIIKDASTKFGSGLIDKGVIADAWKLTLDDSKKKMTFHQYIDRTKRPGDGLSPATENMLLTNLKAWSQVRALMPKAKADALADMILKGQNPNADSGLGITNPDGSLMSDEQIMAKNGVDTKKFDVKAMRELYDIFKPGGAYLQTFATLSQYEPGLNIGEDYNGWLKNNFEDLESTTDGVNKLSYKISKDSRFREILIPTTVYAFGYTDGRYLAGNNLAWIKRQSRQLGYDPDKISFGTISPEFYKGLFNHLLGTPTERKDNFSEKSASVLPLPTQTSPRGEKK